MNFRGSTPSSGSKIYNRLTESLRRFNEIESTELMKIRNPTVDTSIIQTKPTENTQISLSTLKDQTEYKRPPLPVPTPNVEIERLETTYENLKRQYQGLEAFIKNESQFERDEAKARVKSLQQVSVSVAAELREVKESAAQVTNKVIEQTDDVINEINTRMTTCLDAIRQYEEDIARLNKEYQDLTHQSESLKSKIEMVINSTPTSIGAT